MADEPVNSGNVNPSDLKPRNYLEEGLGGATSGDTAITSDWSAMQAKKNRAVESAYGQATAAQDIYKSMLGRERRIGSGYDAATQAGVQNMRRGNAQALQAQSSAAGAGNTGMFNNMLQSAMNYGQQASGFLASQQQAKQQAMMGAQDASNNARMLSLDTQQKAQEYELMRGSEQGDIEKSNMAAQADVQDVINRHTGKLGLDEEAASAELYSMAIATTDPYKKAVYNRQAEQIANSSWF